MSSYVFNAGVATKIDFPGSQYTNIVAINNGGDIAGQFLDTGSIYGANVESFVESEGNYTAISFPGSQDTYVTAINDADTVVGYYGIGATTHGFIESGGVYTSLGYPNVAALTSINNFGTVTGAYSDGQEFIYSGGNYTNIEYPGAEGTGITEINNENVLVGVYYTGSPLNIDVASYTEFGGKYTNIVYPGSSDTYASAINDLGAVAGAANLNIYSCPCQGFIYFNGMYTEVMFPGSDRTTLEGIDDANGVVGLFSDGNKYKGFLELNGIYTAISYPTEIYGTETLSDGISGSGIYFGNFMTPVPEPRTWALLLMAFGGMGASLRIRRSHIAGMLSRG